MSQKSAKSRQNASHNKRTVSKLALLIVLAVLLLVSGSAALAFIVLTPKNNSIITVQSFQVRTVTVVTPRTTPRHCSTLLVDKTSNNYGQISLSNYNDCKEFLVHFHYYGRSSVDISYDDYWIVSKEYSKVNLSVALGRSPWSLWIVVSTRGLEHLDTDQYNRIKPPYRKDDPSTYLPDPVSALFPPEWPPAQPVVDNPFEWETVWWPGWRMLIGCLIAFGVGVHIYRRVKGITKSINMTLVIWGFVGILILAFTCSGWFGDLGYYFQHLVPVVPSIPVQTPFPFTP